MSLVIGTIIERLASALGRTVTVYLACVFGPPIVGGPGICPPYPPRPPVPPAQDSGSTWGGPPLTPDIPPGGGHVSPIPLADMEAEASGLVPCQPTLRITGTVGFVGSDYLVLRIPVSGVCKDLLIPLSAIGMVVF